jgi:glycosyltransferase involved in cell wall biosynthesis
MDGVTVVIPTYNGSRFIGESLDSVYAQTVLPLEIIVVDDRSTDGTPEIVRDSAKRSPVPLRVIELERTSGGPAHPMNVGLEATATETVALLDQDDVLCREQVALISQTLGKDPEIGLAFGESRLMDENGKVCPVFHRVHYVFPDEGGKLGPGEVFTALVTHSHRFGGAGGTAVRKQTWRDLGGFNSKYSICWDLDFVLRLAIRGWSVAYVPHEFFYHRNHESNLAQSENSMRCVCEETQVLFDAFHRSDALPPAWRASLSAALSARVNGAAYWQRRRRRYLNSLQRYWFALRHGVSLPSTTAGLIKLIIDLGIHSIRAVECGSRAG